MLRVDLRLLELAETDVSTPEPEEPTEPEAVLEPETVIDEIMPAEGTANVLLAASTALGGGGTSFHFMQESELDLDPSSFENGAEFVEKEDAMEPASAIEPAVILEETVTTMEVMFSLLFQMLTVFTCNFTRRLLFPYRVLWIGLMMRAISPNLTTYKHHSEPRRLLISFKKQLSQKGSTQLKTPRLQSQPRTVMVTPMPMRMGLCRREVEGAEVVLGEDSVVAIAEHTAVVIEADIEEAIVEASAVRIEGASVESVANVAVRIRSCDSGNVLIDHLLLCVGFRGKPFNGPNGEQGGQWRGNSNGDGEYRGRGRGRGRGAPGNADRGCKFRPFQFTMWS